MSAPIRKRPPREKTRRFEKLRRLVHPDRVMPARVFRTKPDGIGRLCIEVRVSRTRRQMFDCMRWHIGGRMPAGVDHKTMGACFHRYTRHGPNKNSVRLVGPGSGGYVVARIHMNEKDAIRSGAEIVSHESSHAGIAYAKYRGLRVFKSATDEEAMVYAIGKICQAVNDALYAHGLWRK